jgi:L-lactate utilization protein LutC
MPDPDTVERTMAAMRSRNLTPIHVSTGQEAFRTILELIPKGATVYSGTSTTLKQIGLTDFLMNTTEYRFLNKEVTREADAEKRLALRRWATTADYAVGSVPAIAETGQLIAADASGSRIVAYAYTARHVIIVASTNKIVPSVEAGIQRIREVALPKEDQRIKESGGKGSYIGKVLIIEYEGLADRITVILVDEPLGF